MGKKYFSVGEFAALFHVSKQTLFYYEKNNIFLPDYVNEKGYRFYSYEQICLFEVIMSLRAIEIPLTKIAWYMNNRSIQNLKEMLSEKKQEYTEEIALLQKKKTGISEKLKNLAFAESILMDKITLEHKEERYLIKTPFVLENSDINRDLRQLTVHNRKVSEMIPFNENLTGYILAREKLEKEQFKEFSSFFTFVSNPSDCKSFYTRPSGLYATIYKKDAYHTKYVEMLQMIKSFIDSHNLLIMGDAYITPIRSFWSAIKTDEYITAVAVRVGKREECKRRLP